MAACHFLAQCTHGCDSEEGNLDIHAPERQRRQQEALSVLGKLSFRPGAPSAVGSGRAGARYKLHSLLHSLRLESATWADAILALNSTVSITSDLGAESHIVLFPRIPFHHLFPWVDASMLVPEFSLAKAGASKLQQPDVFDTQQSQHRPVASTDFEFVPVATSLGGKADTEVEVLPAAPR